MGWDVPKDWRQLRKEVNLHGIPILDLAEWDARRGTAKRKSNDDGIISAGEARDEREDVRRGAAKKRHGKGDAPTGDARVASEEKKDSHEENAHAEQ